nr:retrovirus-related Pol polyprotein from transposon TNT 1-94 [Tanacetum cinerariifolium]
MDLEEFCEMKGIKREYSIARTPQQNRVAKRKNRTLIEAARTMLADSLLPITFWTEAVNTTCYVLNSALVTKPHNKTSYELLNGRSPRLDFIRPFGCLVSILNTLNPLGKFEGKADEGFLVGYSVTRNQTDKNAGLQDTNGNAGTQDNVDAGKEMSDQHHIVLPLWSSISSTYKSSDDKAKNDKPKDDTEKEASDNADSISKEFGQGCMDQRGAGKAGSTNSFNTVSNPVNVASTLGTFSTGGPSSLYPDAFIPDDTLLHVNQDYSQIPDFEDIAEHKIDLPYGKKAIGTKWVYKNKKDEKGIVVRNKARLMDVKSAFLYGTIEEEVFLKGQPTLGLWCPRDSPFNLEAYLDSDYARANLDKKSTTSGCQFLGRRLISWQCKKYTIIATSTTEAEYVAAANCCGHVLWI